MMLLQKTFDEDQAITIQLTMTVQSDMTLDEDAIETGLEAEISEIYGDVDVTVKQRTQNQDDDSVPWIYVWCTLGVVTCLVVVSLLYWNKQKDPIGAKSVEVTMTEIVSEPERGVIQKSMPKETTTTTGKRGGDKEEEGGTDDVI